MSPTTIEFKIEPPQPFSLKLTALALVRRGNNRIDVWESGTYRRVVPLDEPGGPTGVEDSIFLEVTGHHDQTQLSATTTEPLPTDEVLYVRAAGALSESALMSAATKAVHDLFGFDTDLRGFAALAEADDQLRPLAHQLRGLRPPRYPSVFQALLNAVPCQQVTLVLGLTLLERLSLRYGPALPFLPDAKPGVPLPLPTAAALEGADPEELFALGLSRAKARTLRELSAEALGGQLDLTALHAAENTDAAAALTRLYGVGRWTAEYVLLRGLGRLDVFPYGDSGARNGLARFLGVEGKPDYDWVQNAVSPWQPWAGFVYLHLLVRGMLERGDVP